MAMMKKILVLSLVLVAGCKSVDTTQPGVVGVERRQSMLVSSDTVNRSAVKAYAQVLAEAQKKGQLNRDAGQLERVRAIANRLIPQTGAFRADAPSWHGVGAHDNRPRCSGSCSP